MGAIAEDYWLAVAVRDASLGDYTIVAAYLPPSRRGAGLAVYADYWSGMLESGRRLQLRFGITASRLAILGDMNAHLGALPGGTVPAELLCARQREGY